VSSVLLLHPSLVDALKAVFDSVAAKTRQTRLVFHFYFHPEAARRFVDDVEQSLPVDFASHYDAKGAKTTKTSTWWFTVKTLAQLEDVETRGRPADEVKIGKDFVQTLRQQFDHQDLVALSKTASDVAAISKTASDVSAISKTASDFAAISKTASDVSAKKLAGTFCLRVFLVHRPDPAHRNYPWTAFPMANFLRR
jgi:hypothetical protein